MPLNRNKLKSRRLSLGLTLEDVASKLSVSKQTVQRYESGQIARIYTDTVEMLSSALNCPPAYLMDWDDSILLTDSEQSLIDAFRVLPSPAQDDVIEYVDFKAAKVGELPPIQTITPEVREDPFMVIAAHADEGMTDEDVQENIRRIKEAAKKQGRHDE